MLKRVLEPEVMDTPDEARDYDAMNHATVNCVFVDDLQASGGNLDYVLDLGTATAQIPIELCRRDETARVLAVDMAVEMLELARLNIELANLIERIVLDRADAKALPYDDGQFSAVISNSIVHHIPEPQSVVTEAKRVVSPGGLIFFRDLLRPEDDADVHRLVEMYAGGENDHQRKMFDDSLRAALSLEEIRDLVERAGFDRQSVQVTSDRHWTWCAQR